MTSARVRVSAVVCTHSRRRYLERCVDSLLRQSIAPSLYEILVVDNRSEDDTADFLEALTARETEVRSLFEESLGLSRARNAALASARGEIIAFLDDDAIARGDWIERILHAFDEGGASIGVVTGRTQPIWEAERPEWLSERGLGALAIVDRAPRARFLVEGEFLVGANMAFRTRLLREVGGFPEHLGRVGPTLLSGEETFVAELLGERGIRTYYDPEVVVSHHVQPERIERSWLIRRSYWQGVSNALRDSRRGLVHSGSVAAGAGLRVIGCSALALLFLARRDPARRFDEYMSVARSVGEISARLGVRRHVRASARPPRSPARISR